MAAPRYFLMGGGSSPEELLDRAAARGVVVRAAAHHAPVGSGVYGAVEIQIPEAEARVDGGENAPRGEDRRKGMQPEGADLSPCSASRDAGDEGAGATPGSRAGAAPADHLPAPAPGEPDCSRFAPSDEGEKQEVGAP